MKKITKCLMTLALLCMAGVANASYQIQLGTKFTSVESLKGKVFAIADEAEGKAFYGPTGGYGHEVAFAEYNTAFTSDVNYYYFKLVDIPADSVKKYPQLSGYTLIRACKADGSLYTFWGDGNNGYLNTNDGTLFLLGITAKFYGQDFDFGAVWKVEYVADKGFTIKSKYTEDKYLKDAGAPKNAEPTYFTFAEVSSVEIFDPDTSDPGVDAIPEGKVSLIKGAGTFTDNNVASFFVKEKGAGNASQATITSDAGRLNGNGIKATSISTASNEWDSQFWIKFNDVVPNGTTIHIEFDYRASEATTISSQQQTGGFGYLGGGLSNFNASINWKHLKQDFTINKDNVQSIVFNLNVNKTKAIDFYFDNFLVYAEAPKEITWKEIYSNNGTDVNTVMKKYFKNYLAAETKNGAIVVENLDPDKTYTEYENDGKDAKVENDHDVQFLIALPKVLKKDQRIKFSMDVKADVATGDKDADVQAHSNFPVSGVIEQTGGYGGTYKHYTIGATAVDFTTEWTNYEATVTIPNEADGMSIICLNLEKLRQVNTYYFKNIKVFVSEDDLAGLTDAKQTNPVVVTAAGFATFVPVKDVIIPEGVTAYTATLEEGKVVLNKVTDTKLHAGDPFVIEAAQGCVNFEVTTGAPVIENNDLSYSDGTVVSSDNSYYVLATGTHGPGFYLLDNDVTIPAGKAYLMVEAGGREFIGFADEATAIKTIETAKAKGAIFNLAGQQVKKAQKGIYIIDGKKAIVK